MNILCFSEFPYEKVSKFLVCITKGHGFIVNSKCITMELSHQI